MSRSEYTDDCDDNLAFGRWRAQVASAMRGARGQAFLKELLAALDAMPEKKLVASHFEKDGCYCTLGVIAKQRGVALSEFDPDDCENVGPKLGIANQMAREIMYENDEFSVWNYLDEKPDRSDDKRWQHMRDWVASQIKEAAP